MKLPPAQEERWGHSEVTHFWSAIFLFLFKLCFVSFYFLTVSLPAVVWHLPAGLSLLPSVLTVLRLPSFGGTVLVTLLLCFATVELSHLCT